MCLEYQVLSESDQNALKIKICKHHDWTRIFQKLSITRQENILKQNMLKITNFCGI